MLLGFKRQFAPFVREGSKTHTIRDKGGRVWKPGVVCDCFVDPRQKTMELLGRFPCVRVQDIRIDILPAARWIRIAGGLVITSEVRIDGTALELSELGPFAWRDGFRDNGKGPAAFVQMLGFWRGRLPFEGDLIHWQYAPELAGVGVTMAASRAAARALSNGGGRR